MMVVAINSVLPRAVIRILSQKVTVMNHGRGGGRRLGTMAITDAGKGQMNR